MFDILQLPGQLQKAWKTPLMTVDVHVEGNEMRVGVDTGASTTITREEEWNKLHKLQQTNT